MDFGLFNDPSMADPDAEANASSGEIEWLDPKMFTGDLAITDTNNPALTEILTGTGDWGTALKNIFGSKSGQIAGTLGLAALANKMFGSSGGGGYAGYQGGIPSYTASRTMLPIPTTTKTVSPQGVETLLPRRPGSGGITYFSPMTYTLNPSGTTTGTTTGSNTGATTNTTTGSNTGATTNTTTGSNTGATTNTTTGSNTGATTNTTTGSNTGATTNTTTGGTTNSTQTTQSSGATTQVPNTVSSNVVPEGYFRNPVQSSGSLSQIPGALNDGEFLPILKDADWYMTRDLEDVPKDLSRIWRDPVSGYGISVDPYRDVSAAAFTYYDPQGRKLRSSIFNTAELYKNAQEFGIDLSGISDLGKKLDAAGVPYKPGELYPGTGSDHGINFADVASGVPKGARGGIASLSHGIQNGHLGSYSDGGQLLRGPGDGVSDDIPATIADKQPARLADGEFVIPARIVSELGNGSTEAGARKLYAMMDRIKKARRSAKDIAADTKTDRYLPR